MVLPGSVGFPKWIDTSMGSGARHSIVFFLPRRLSGVVGCFISRRDVSFAMLKTGQEPYWCVKRGTEPRPFTVGLGWHHKHADGSFGGIVNVSKIASVLAVV